MRLFTRGVHCLDTCLSISYDAASCSTRALLHRCTKAQQAAIKAQIEANPISSTMHPLFLPVALLAIKRKIIGEQRDMLWRHLTDAEMQTGQTGAPIFRHYAQSDEDDDINEITKQVIGVIQLSTAAEQHAKTLLTVLEAVQKSIQTIGETSGQRDIVQRVGEMLTERLDFIEQKTKMLIFDLQYFEKRAQAQLTAVSAQDAESFSHVDVPLM